MPPQHPEKECGAEKHVKNDAKAGQKLKRKNKDAILYGRGSLGRRDFLAEIQDRRPDAPV